jgi:hypothetical protein
MSVSVQHNTHHFLSSKEAGTRSGYTSDYISRLAREGKVVAKRVGISWFVELSSLEVFLADAERAREARKEALRLERSRERAERVAAHTTAQSDLNSGTDFSQQSYTHTVNDVVEVYTSEVDEATFPSVLGTSDAHIKALLAVGVGTSLALLLMLTPVMQKVEQSPAFALGAFVELFGRSSWFVFPWSSEFAVAPHAAPAHLTQEPQARSGIVVLPGDASQETIAQVKESFSDDVVAAVDQDGTTGTIIPVFQDGAGDAYRFVIVPVAEPP